MDCSRHTTKNWEWRYENTESLKSSSGKSGLQELSVNESASIKNRQQIRIRTVHKIAPLTGETSALFWPTCVSSWCLKEGIIVEGVPVVLWWMSRIPTPRQVSLGDVVLDEVLNHSSWEQSVKFSLEESYVDVERSLGVEGVVEDRLLVGLAPAVSPTVSDTIHVHPSFPKTHHATRYSTRYQFKPTDILDTKKYSWWMHGSVACLRLCPKLSCNSRYTIVSKSSGAEGGKVDSTGWKVKQRDPWSRGKWCIQQLLYVLKSHVWY